MEALPKTRRKRRRGIYPVDRRVVVADLRSARRRAAARLRSLTYRPIRLFLMRTMPQQRCIRTILCRGDPIHLRGARTCHRYHAILFLVLVRLQRSSSTGRDCRLEEKLMIVKCLRVSGRTRFLSGLRLTSSRYGSAMSSIVNLRLGSDVLLFLHFRFRGCRYTVSNSVVRAEMDGSTRCSRDES